MAELVHFYRGGVTPESFERLDLGQIAALVGHKDSVIRSQKEAAENYGI